MNNSTSPAAWLNRCGLQTVLACLLACVWTVALADEGRAQDPSGDREALVALYNATEGANWEDYENWLSDGPLKDWHGVTDSDGRVTRLALSNNQLTGPIPSKLGQLSSLEPESKLRRRNLHQEARRALPLHRVSHVRTGRVSQPWPGGNGP